MLFGAFAKETVDLAELEYRVELREDPHEKLITNRLAQPYQPAWLHMSQGKMPGRGDTIGFVKGRCFHLGCGEDRSKSNPLPKQVRKRLMLTTTHLASTPLSHKHSTP